MVEVHEVMLHAKYQDSRPCGFRQEDFFHVFNILAYVKYVTPELNKLGKGPLDNLAEVH